MNDDQKSNTKASNSIPKEVARGELEIIPGHPVSCAVLDNEMRVLSTRGFSRAFGYRKTGTDKNRTGAPQPPPFLASSAIKSFLSDELIVRLNSPIVYQPKMGGRTAYGYDHSVFPDICKAIVAADDEGKLTSRLKRIADAARATVDALVGVGMVALIDEATGYRPSLEDDAYQKLVRAYVVPEMRPWLRRFPPEFTDLVFKLMGWKRNDKSTLTPRFQAKLINDWVYSRLPEPVLPELRRVNPAVNGQRRAKHHQHLTPDTGIPHLDRQIIVVMAFMRAARDRRQLEEMLVRAFPVPGDQMPLGTATEVEVKTENKGKGKKR